MHHDEIAYLQEEVLRQQRIINRTLAVASGLALGLAIVNFRVLRRHDVSIQLAHDAVRHYMGG